ncbi:MAG: zinc ribbon domain-containing protein [Verrucomicrobiales bacterium]|nr:zinc ribbon domain-containing protein [Verrucomicrobiales bacterium]MCP5557031.1 zinc ribbon domain-containing protein [Verrucomicrobiaceae bacterium]
MSPPTNRRQLLEAIFAARNGIADLSWKSATGGQSDDADVARLSSELSSLIDGYRSTLVSIPVSRCPFTGEPWNRKTDISGLDGLWWDFEAPVRVAERVPASFVALTGSLQVGRTVEDFPFLCKPGPEVPYVLPYLLRIPGIRAVLSRVAIGRHTGTAITYFSQNPASGFPLPSEWGSSRNVFLAASGGLVTTQDHVPEEAFDYDLKPYLEDGRLLWIAPEDAELTLRSGIADCPYVDLPGRRSLLFISRGKVWTSEDPPPMPDKFADIPMVDFSDVMAEIETEAASSKPTKSTTTRRCPHCGEAVRAGAKFCGHCGKNITVPADNLCPACGGKVAPKAKFCGHCGHRMEKP